MRYTFLVTAIGGDIGYNVTKLLRAHYPECTIIGTDILEENIGLHYVDNFSLVPRANKESYSQELDELIEKFKVDLCFILSEQEIKAVTLCDSFKNKDKVKIMQREDILTFLDKYETNKFFKSTCEVDAPFSEGFIEDYCGEFPVVVKSKEGRGSAEVHIIRDKDSFQKLDFDDSYMIQEYVDAEDEEYTCGVYITKKRKVYSIILKRKLIGDSTGIARLVEHVGIEDYINKIAKNIKSFGAFNIQLRLSSRGPLCFEINPRISSTVAMRDLLGFQDVFWTVEEHFNRDIDYKINNELIGKMIVRVPDVKLV